MPRSRPLASTGVVSATQLYAPYGARYYDPLAGQFTSADTTLAGGLNRYAYVGGNPETWVDPNGHAQREGAEGEAMIVLGGDGNDVGAGGSLGDTGAGGVDPVLPATYNGPETTYGAGTDGAVHFDVQNGQVDGVDGADGQLLETNAQIEAQAEADATDVLHQEDIHQAETNAQNGKNTTATNDTSTPTTPQNAEDYRTSRGVKDAKGNRPAAAAIATQEGATPVTSTSSQPGVENPGFNIDDPKYNGKCAEVACASQIMHNVQNGEGGWKTGNDVTINLSQVNRLGPCESCRGVMYQLASAINAPVTVNYLGPDGSILPVEFQPGVVPYGG